MSENMENRLEIIDNIEKKINAKIITYICGDRPGALSQTYPDAIRPMYDHLKSIGNVEKIILYLYGIGGVLEVPWRMVTMIREFCDSFEVIIPYKAYSAVSLIALGADKNIIGRKGELSPIDPSLILSRKVGIQPFDMPPEIGVEDIYAYIRFIKEKAGLTDQEALAKQIGILTEKMSPTVLGMVQRAYSHTRLVARKLLSLQKPPLEETRKLAIIDALTEKIYAHGHGIGRQEAKEIGLTIEIPDDELEELIWSLYLNYEDTLNLMSTPDISWYIRDDENQIFSEENTDIAFIESLNMSHAYRGIFEVKMLRKIPENLNINLNLSLQMPPGIQLEELPQNISQVLGQIVQQAAPRIVELVRSEIVRQSPISAVASRHRFAKWTKIR